MASVPKLDLKTALGHDESQDRDLKVREVASNELSWGTPLSTPSASQRPPAGVSSRSNHDQPVPDKPKQQPYYYLDTTDRLEMDLSAYIPNYPTANDDSEVMAKFFLDFADLVLADCYEKIEAQTAENNRIKDIVREQMKEDCLSAGAMTSNAQQVKPIGRNPGVLKGKCRRLHDTEMAPKGSVTSASLEQYKSFTARFITKDSVKAIKELHGFFFLIDDTMMVYNYRNLGRSNYSKPVTLIAPRLSYSFAHGRRKGENFKARDIRPGGTLSFLKPGNPEPIYVRITAVEDYEPKSFDTWWGCPTGGALTEEERKDRKVLEGVQKLVKDRLKENFIKSISSLQKQFAKLDKSGDGSLSKDELQQALSSANIRLSIDEFESVWRIVDEDQSGAIGYEEFLTAFIGEMTEERAGLVQKAWKKLDPKGEGKCSVFDAEKTLSFKIHPKVKSGEKQESEIRQKFFTLLESRSNELLYRHFYDFFLMLSLLIDRDRVFFNIMFAVFGL